MKKNLCYYLLSFSISVLFFSCIPRKKVIYFQGDPSSAEINKNYNPVFHTDDLLSITVMGMDAETVKPFNLPIQSGMLSPGGYAQGTPTPPGYLIDIEGNIDFPLTGKMKVAGLSRTTIIDSLKLRLKPYLTNPTIIVRILNFKVTVLGEVLRVH